MRNARLRRSHLSGNLAPQPDNRDFGRAGPLLPALAPCQTTSRLQERVQVVVRDSPRRPAAGHSRQLDARLARPPPHRWRRERPLALRGRCGRRCRRRRCGRGGRCRRRSGSRRVGWRGFRGRLGFGSGFGFRFSALAFDVEYNQLGANRDHVARLAGCREHLAADGRRNHDGCLVGHQIHKRLVLGDRLALLDFPLDNLAFDDAFADIRQLEYVLAHFSYSPSSAQSLPSLAPGWGSIPIPACGDKECPTP